MRRSAPSERDAPRRGYARQIFRKVSCTIQVMRIPCRVRIGTQEAVHEAEYRRKDQRKVVQIVGLTALISAVVAVAAFLVPLP